MPNAMVMTPKDNVAVVVQDTNAGEIVTAGCDSLAANEFILQGHKIALCDIAKDAPITKYGITIGLAASDIRRGDWVHCHNIVDNTEQFCNEFAAAYRAKYGNLAK